MVRAISTHLFSNHRLTTALLERIQNAGIPAVEIFCARQHLDYRNRAQLTELKHWFRDSPLELHSLHAPMYTDDVWGRTGPHSVINITERTKSRRVEMVDEVKRAIEVAEYVPFRYLIQHLGVSGEEYDERKIDSAFSSLEELGVFARQRQVEVLLENIPNQLSTPERLVQFLNMTHLKVNLCFDIGHAHIGGGVEEAFQVMKTRIRSTHVHDNNGTDDAHLFPLISEDGTIDWGRTMELLRTDGDQYPLLLELKETPEYKAPLDKVNESFDKLEAL